MLLYLENHMSDLTLPLRTKGNPRKFSQYDEISSIHTVEIFCEAAVDEKTVEAYRCIECYDIIKNASCPDN